MVDVKLVNENQSNNVSVMPSTKRKLISRICYLDTVYSFILYVLWCSEKELKDTLFVFTDRMPNSILNKINNKIVFKYVFSSNQLKYQKFRLLNWLKLKKINLAKDCEYFGNDRLCYSHFFVQKNNFTLIEDGTMNYNLEYFKSMNIRYEKTNILRRTYRKIFWHLYEGTNHMFLGMDKRVKKILLTGICPTPKMIENKVIVKDFKTLWSTSQNKKFIRSIFDLENCVKENMKIDNLLITQPINVSEEKKINFYKSIVTKYNNVVIKPHPRETTNYEELFPKNIVLEKSIPAQLLLVMNMKFKKIITICSTAALSLKSEETELIWFGKNHINKI